MTGRSDRFQVALEVYASARSELESALEWWDQFLPTDGTVTDPDKIAVREAYHIVRAAEHKFDRAFVGLWEAFGALPVAEEHTSP